MSNTNHSQQSVSLTAELRAHVRATAQAINSQRHTAASRLLESLLNTFDLHFDHGLSRAAYGTAQVHVYVCIDAACENYIATADYHYNRQRATFTFPARHARNNCGRGEAYIVLVQQTCRWLKAKRPAEFAAYEAAWAAVEAEGLPNALASICAAKAA